MMSGATIRQMITAVLLCLALTGCGGGSAPGAAPKQPQTTTAAAYFPFSNQSFIMTDQYGHHLYVKFALVAGPIACASGTLLSMTLTKDATDGYWFPGTPNAQATFFFSKYADGSVGVKGWWDNIGKGWDTVNVHRGPKAGAYPPYLFMAADTDVQQVVNAGQTVRYNSQEAEYGVAGETDICVDANNATSGPTIWVWDNIWRPGYVSTPAYHGPTVDGVQIEGNYPTSYNQEVWSFAPGLGLVQIVDVFGHVVKRQN